MSVENATRRPRSPAKTVPENDHRKRRRNRTTQSCVNCHASKRMCDRKRPACARCTQLGLTGLCVYEVDDPNQQPDMQDESSRLLKRVAELEGVIRELKNKPHPRWARPSVATVQEHDTLPPSPGREPERGSCHQVSLGEVPAIPQASLDNGAVSPVSYLSTSPLSSPSPANSPTSPTGFSSPNAFLNHPEFCNAEYDLPSMFLHYPGLLGYDNANLASLMLRRDGSDCHCLQDTSTYNTMLELSLRLRKAAEALALSPRHSPGSKCELDQRVSEMDRFVSNSLTGAIPGSPSNIHFCVNTPSRSHHGSAGVHSALSPQGFNDLHPCVVAPSASGSGSKYSDDHFMTWEPPLAPYS